MNNNLLCITLPSSYRNAAIRSAELATLDSEESNRWAKKALECSRILSQSDDGRQHIITLIRDSNPYVRCLAASQCLQWVPDDAGIVLGELRDSNGPGAFEAKWALIAFNEGTLSFNY